MATLVAWNVFGFYVESGRGGRRKPSGMNCASMLAVALRTFSAPSGAGKVTGADGGMQAPMHGAEQAPQLACAAAPSSAVAVLACASARRWHDSMGIVMTVGSGAHAMPILAGAACSGTAVIRSRISHVLKSLSIVAQCTTGASA